MGLHEQLSGPAKRLHDFVGRDATVENRMVDYDNRDSDGNPGMNKTEIQTSAEVSSVGSGSFERRYSGFNVDASASVWLPHDVDVYDGTEDSDRRASRIHIDSETYEVVDVVVEDTGRKRCLCNQK